MSSHNTLRSVPGVKKSDKEINAALSAKVYNLTDQHRSLASLSSGRNHNLPSRPLHRQHSSTRRAHGTEQTTPRALPSQQTHSQAMDDYSISPDHRYHGNRGSYMLTRRSNSVLSTVPDDDDDDDDDVADDINPPPLAPLSSPATSPSDTTGRIPITQRRFSNDRDSFLKDIARALQAKTHRRDRPLEKIVTRHSLMGIWTEACLEAFIDLWKPGFHYGSISLIREEYLQTLSILVDVGWTEWSSFGEIFLNPDAMGERGRSDRMIPTYTLAVLEDEAFLGPPWAEKFLASQYTFCPIDIQEGKSLLLSKGWRLPFTNGESLKIGHGGYGQVTKEVIGSGHFLPQSEHHLPGAPYNRDITVAVKRFAWEGHFHKETKNLETLRSSLSKHDRIVPFLAIVAIGNEFNILFPAASMDLEEFLLTGHKRLPDLTLRDLIQECENLAGALAFLHEGLDSRPPGRSCCHMDLKPDNILIFHGESSHFPKVGKWKISDFGISTMTRSRETGMTVTEFVDGLGEPQKATRPPGTYQPPDGDRFGPWSDVWSLGCIMTRVLALGLEKVQGMRNLDQLRFKGDDGVSGYDNDYFHRGSPAALNPHIKTWLLKLPSSHGDYSVDFLEGCKSLIFSMLAIDPNERPHAKEVQRELHLLMPNAEQNITSSSSSASSPSESDCTINRNGSSSSRTTTTSATDRVVSLIRAIDLECQFTVETLLKQDVDVETRAMIKDTVLERPLVHAILMEYTAAVELLLNHRRDLDLETPNSKGNTPLKLAAERGSVELVETLLARGAIVDAPSRRGVTPLMSACRHGHEPIVRILLSNGADCSRHSHDGFTSLHYATFSDNGAKIIELLRGRLPSLNIGKSDNGETPFLTLLKNYADTKPWWDKFAVLLVRGADINMADQNGNTPLSYAMMEGHYRLADMLERENAKYGSLPEPPHMSSDMKRVWRRVLQKRRRSSEASSGSSRSSKSLIRRLSTFRS
ncbi:hypothetical protein BBP40_011933 [Aspergillus hancockii]|nr:hypothetical protein BBP40_011933 [Aspergillus hancockii]